jgi:cell division protein ZapA
VSESVRAQPVQVAIKILDKEYHIACGANERAALLESAEYLNKQMREIRETGKVAGVDRVAVMAALNMANELLQLRAQSGGAELGTRLKTVRERVENALQRRLV